MRKILLTLLSLTTCLGLWATAPRLMQKQRPQGSSPSAQRITEYMQRHMPRTRAHSNVPSLTPRHATMTTPLLSALTATSGSTIYGWLGYTNDDTKPTGFTTLSLDGTYSAPQQLCPYTVAGAWMRQGSLYVYTSSSFNGIVMANYLYQFDAATGAKQKETAMPESFSQLPRMATYDPEEDIVYGFAWTPDGYSSRFFTAPGANPTDMTYGFEMEEPPTSLCYDAAHRVLLAVVENNLVSLNPVTGAQTVLAATPEFNQLPTGLCYSPRDEAYIWNVNYTDADGKYASALYKIAYPGYTFTKLASYPMEEEFVSLMCTDTPQIDVSAPAAIEIRDIATNGADPRATVTMVAPTTQYDGTALSGTIDYDCYLDGNFYNSGYVGVGQTFTVTYSDLSEGMHRFSVRGRLNDRQGPEAYRKAYIGNDTPLAPADVVLNAEGITWSPVTAGVNAGYLDTAALTYDVYVNDTQVGTDVTGTSVAYVIPDGDMAGYTARVIAKCHGKSSEPGYSDNFIAGHALYLPVNLMPTKTQFNAFTVQDCNHDGRTWEWTDTNTDDALVYLFSPSNDGNDWVFLPAIQFPDADALYEFTGAFCMGDTRLSETFEVKMGRQPNAAAMTQTLIPSTELKEAIYNDYNALFGVPEAGDYYIGIHATSPADHYFIYARNFRIDRSTKNGAAPGPVTDLTATPAPLGALSANVQFTLPTVAMNGQRLLTDEELTAVLTCYDNTVTLHGLPGARLTTDITTIQGVNMIDIVCSNSQGAGAQASVKLRCGIDKPGDPLNVALNPDETDLNLTFTWDAPSEVGLNGGYCPSTGITYWLCQEDQFGWNATEKMGTDVYSFPIKLAGNAKQKIYTYGIMAANSEGKSGQVQTASCIAGKPFTLPFFETFTTEGGVNGPVAQLQPTPAFQASWFLGDPANMGSQFARPGTDCAMICTNETSGPNYGLLGLSKVSTLDTDCAALKATVYLGSCDDIEFAAMGYGDTEFTTIGHIKDMNCPAGYNEIILPMPASLQGRPWVQIYMNVTMSQQGQGTILCGYGVDNVYDHDVAVDEVYGPARIGIGETKEYKAIVRNAGYEPMQLPSGGWQVRNGQGTIIERYNTPAGQILQPGQSEVQVLELEGNIDFSHEFTLEYYINSPDMNEDNNIARMTGWLDDKNVQGVTDLRAVMADDAQSVNLTWTEPAIGFVSESFEDEPAGVQLPATIAGFKNIDRDGRQVYSDTGIPNQGLPIGFAVMDVFQSMVCTECDGRNIVYTICPSETDPSTGKCYAADDWLISPQVRGGSELSFMARGFQRYWEDVEILTSSTGDNPEDFTLLKAIQLKGIDWTKYTFTLPEDAKYFAIHYVSVDQLGACFDLITYETSAATAKVANYEVERNDAVVATGAPAIGAFADLFAVDASQEYRYRITPILQDGRRGTPSNTAYMTTSGLNVLNTDAADAQYYDLLGRRLSGPTRGITIRRQGTTATKTAR